MSKNEIKLQEGHPVDENLRPIKVGGDMTSLELSSFGNGARVNGDLSVNGNVYSDTVIAGQILGYTRLEGDLTNQAAYEIQNSLTVEDDTHQITFTTPPSEYVEIELTCFVDIGSTDTEINAGLSSASATSGYSAVSAELEYDAGTGTMFSDDEIDDGMLVVKFICKAAHLASIGSSNTFYIGFSTGGVTKTATVRYGYRASHGQAYPPMTIKATALPTTIYDGQ